MTAAAPGQPAGAVSRREQVFELLLRSPEPQSIAAIAETLDIHVNTVRFHLDSLHRAGRVERVDGHADGPGRPPSRYRATPRMDPDGPSNYRLLAAMLTAHLAASSPDPRAAALEIGRSWGPRVLGTDGPSSRRHSRATVVTRVVDGLEGLGFRPETPRGPRDQELRLRHCPFLELVTREGQGEVVCALHLGLLQGGMAALHGPITVGELAPLVEPDLCVAHLAPASSQGAL